MWMFMIIPFCWNFILQDVAQEYIVAVKAKAWEPRERWEQFRNSLYGPLILEWKEKAGKVGDEPMPSALLLLLP